MSDQETLPGVPPGEILAIEIIPGRFTKGNRLGGRRPGDLDRCTRRMKSELAAHFDATGEQGNLLLILARIAADPEEESDVRIRAADKCLRYLAPRLLSVSSDGPEPEEMERRTAVTIEAVHQLIAGIDPKKISGASS